jgi:hypothetical protein
MLLFDVKVVSLHHMNTINELANSVVKRNALKARTDILTRVPEEEKYMAPFKSAKKAIDLHDRIKWFRTLLNQIPENAI